MEKTRKTRKIRRKRNERKSGIMRLLFTFTISALIVISAFSGCKSQPPPTPAKSVKPQGQISTPVQPEVTQAQAQETEQAEGYVYQPRDRRDPFVPLIATKKSQKKAALKVGTLESYDISEFALLAIAQKSEKYFALLVTPDNRSFTVHKGTVIGISKGRVEEISKNKVVIVEYSKDYKGDIHPKQITLELLKER
jgi:Tfp pilus assembly protein PilP